MTNTNTNTNKTEYRTTKDVTKRIMMLCKISGLLPENNSKLGIFYFWLMATTNVVYIVATTIKCFQQTSLETFSVTYIDFLVTSQSTAKGVALYRNRKKLGELLHTLWYKFWPLSQSDPKAAQYNQRYLRTINFLRNYQIVLFSCIVQISINSLTKPYRAQAYNLYFFGYENDLFLRSPIYEILYVFECLTLSPTFALWLVPHDMLYIVFCGCATVQFDMIQDKLKRIGEVDEAESYKIIRECVDHHNLVLNFLKDFETVVTFTILKQYIDAISVMGIYIYLSQQQFHFVYAISLCSNLSQTLFFSYFGQMIQDKSVAIAYAAFNNKWHLMPSKRVREALILIQVRAQKPTRMSAGGFLYLSFESFVGMLKAAGSFLAVLRSRKD